MREWQEWCFPGGEEEEGGHFPNLCGLCLVNCPKLTGKLRLDYFPRLEWVSLQKVNIESLACSQECNKFNIELPSLRDLEIEDCPNLVCFVGGGVLLAPNLKRISMCSFKNLWSVPDDMQISLPSLQSLFIMGSKEFKSFPEESKFPSLDDLEIIECPEFVGFPHGGGLQAPNLKKMEIDGCNKFRSLPEEMHASLPSLQSLSIEGSKEFKSFPEESKFPSLKDLFIMKCPEFRSLPEEMHASLPSLQSLFIEGIKEFKSFPEESKFSSLKDLRIMNCPEFRSLPEEMHASLPSLQSLTIQGSKEFKSFPEASKFPSLDDLNIRDCPELESFPEGGLPSKLRSLRIGSCKKLMANRMRWGLQTLTSLKVLDVSFSECEEEETVESFPEEWQLPTTLTYLGISGHRNLKTIDGKALRHLISLKELTIDSCPRLQSLPDEGLPTSLSRLEIRKCDLLTQRCQRDTGEDWAKISHIPHVVIDSRVI
ncbi:hypothetical protein ACFX14_006173 [Malus domestica]